MTVKAAAARIGEAQWMPGGAVALLLAGCAWLAGCAGPGAPRVASETREVQTASDQTEADRRARVRIELASAYFGRGQLNTALDEVKQALAVQPNLAEAYNLRGLIYAAMGDDKLADESFQRALQLNPRDGDTMHNIGWLQCQQKRYDEADAQFVKALAQPQYTNQARTLMTQGICQARAGHLDEAEFSLSRSFELDPSSPVTAVNLAEVLYRRQQYDRARFYIRRVNDQAEVSNAQTLWLAARIEKKLGNAAAVSDLGRQLKARFPQSREAAAFERSQFDE